MAHTSFVEIVIITIITAIASTLYTWLVIFIICNMKTNILCIVLRLKKIKVTVR